MTTIQRMETSSDFALTPTAFGTVVYSVRNVSEATLRAAATLRRHGATVGRRGGQTMRESTGPHIFEIQRPEENTLFLAGRSSNPWVTLAEFPWIVSGRNDIGWLLPYLPRAKDFSDDGLTWRAGYGPRLRGWDTGNNDLVDQLAGVVQLLRDHPDTRQAVISLWDPSVDLDHPSTKDKPCTNWLHFQVHAGHLELTVVMRSNDLFWGFSGVNAHNFTLLQQLVAYCLGLQVGAYRHIASNLHIYQRHFLSMDRIVEYGRSYVDVGQYLYFPTDLMALDLPIGRPRLHAFTERCLDAMDYVEGRRGQPLSSRTLRQLASVYAASPWLSEWSYAMLLHGVLDEGTEYHLEQIASWIRCVHRDDWRCAIAAYVLRHAVKRGWLTSRAEGHGFLRSACGATVPQNILDYLQLDIEYNEDIF